ncbi:MAG TPA: prepilin-type N-terminal cleavage/methylation domain-containing protein [Vicinamibacteria bacterium]|nr:prepilin-type N-terminal cleavage/methylation domain-containing protein [Vicinamibacteria bacterium]
MEDRERGFSLVELMIAMTVTLIITGAVFQLMNSGNTAFQREPAIADRQLNIRVAMDLIAQDLYQAGYGIPAFGQALTDDLDAVGMMGSGGKETDELEIFRAAECPFLKVCPVTGEAQKSINTSELFSACYQFPALVLMADDSKWALRWAEDPGNAASAKPCDGMAPGTSHGHATFPPGQAPIVNPVGGFSGWQPQYMMVGQAIRYRINPEADGVPSLERSAFGGLPDLDGNSTWQIIARGIEDLQVEYENAAGWHDTPGQIDCAGSCAAPTPPDYDRLIRRVRVRLSARVTAGGRLAGETTSAVGTAIRGQLSTEIAPRAASATLDMFNGTL